MADPRCGTCGGAMIRRSPLRLVLVGLLMVAAPAVVAVWVSYLWLLAIVFALGGLYLIAWGAFGKGYWCRECKRFTVLRRGRAAT